VETGGWIQNIVEKITRKNHHMSIQVPLGQLYIPQSQTR